MLPFASSRDETDGVIDESLLEGDDDMEFDAANAQKETEGEEAINGVLQEYMADILAKVKRQIDSHGRPDCYTRGTFWEHPKDPLFALQASATRITGLSPTELYHLDVFIWLPDRIPGFSDKFHCSCSRHRILSRNGWNEKPIARRVKHLYRDYLLLTNRWICDKKQGGCGKSFQGTDPYILSQLPRHFQESFPAILTVRAAVDKQLISLMRTCFATRFGPEPFAALMREMRHLDHAHRELLYLAAAASSAQFYHPRPFSKFSDKNRYAGTSPSTHYCKAVFVDWMRAYRPYFDRVIAALPATVLKGDHTFGVCHYLPFLLIYMTYMMYCLQLTKFFAKLGGVSTHVAMYSGVNEFEECRIQALTLTKSLDYVEGCYKNLDTGLQAHGHPPTQLMYTDNAQNELAYHERTTRSLQENVSHVIIDPFKHLPLLLLPAEQKCTFYEESDLIDAACDHLLSGTQLSKTKLVVGFALCYMGRADAPESGGVHMIQIATGNTVYLFKVSRFLCLIFCT